jgi:ketosteroid isomerase-like protein
MSCASIVALHDTRGSNMSTLHALAGGVLVLLMSPAMADSANEDGAIVAQDRQLNQLIMAGDVKAAAPIYLDEFVLTTSSGVSKNKQGVITEIGNPRLRFELNETSDVTIHRHGDVAVLTGKLHQRGVYQDKAFDSTLRVTDTWVRTRQGWRLLAGHASAAQ